MVKHRACGLSEQRRQGGSRQRAPETRNLAARRTDVDEGAVVCGQRVQDKQALGNPALDALRSRLALVRLGVVVMQGRSGGSLRGGGCVLLGKVQLGLGAVQLYSAPEASASYACAKHDEQQHKRTCRMRAQPPFRPRSSPTTLACRWLDFGYTPATCHFFYPSSRRDTTTSP